jgi:hypothetical protein
VVVESYTLVVMFGAVMLNGLGVTKFPDADVKTFAELAPLLDNTTATALLYEPALCVAAIRIQTRVPLATDTDAP